MSKKSNKPSAWVEGHLRLSGLDSRMFGLLRAIDESGSINQAAKHAGLSYKGAWQIIERANNSAPSNLVATITGGSRGGGTSLTETGRALLALFKRLEQQHDEFIDQLNRSLTNDPDTLLMLKRLIIKTSACNQLFGRIVRITVGAVNAEIIVAIKGDTLVTTTISLASMNALNIKFGAEVVLLINHVDITLAVDLTTYQLSARNQLAGKLISIQQDEVNAEVLVQLLGGEMLTAVITQPSVQALTLVSDIPIWVIFKTNAPILGTLL